MSVTTCRYCDARIMWVAGFKGPVNSDYLLVTAARSLRSSEVLTVIIPGIGVQTNVQRCAPGEPGRVSYIAHAATCPPDKRPKKPKREGGARKPRFDPTPRPKAPPAAETRDLFPVRKPFLGGDTA